MALFNGRPRDTSYSGGFFDLKIKFPLDYPKRPPYIKFITPIYHLNVNSIGIHYEELGKVKFNVINWWREGTKMKEVLTKLYSVFYWSNPDNPYQFETANEYKKDRNIYEAKIKYFTKKYAHYSSPFLYYLKWDFSGFNVSDYNLNFINNENLFEKNDNLKYSNYSNGNIITVHLDNNGIGCRFWVECNEIVREIVFKTLLKKSNISKIREEEILLIHASRRVNINQNFKQNNIRNRDTIVIINDVIFT